MFSDVHVFCKPLASYQSFAAIHSVASCGLDIKFSLLRPIVKFHVEFCPFFSFSQIKEDTPITSFGTQLKQLESPLSSDLYFEKKVGNFEGKNG